jgi:hypothetical protein
MMVIEILCGYHISYLAVVYVYVNDYKFCWYRRPIYIRPDQNQNKREIRNESDPFLKNGIELTLPYRAVSLHTPRNLAFFFQEAKIQRIRP